jgi:hypothetical protein
MATLTQSAPECKRTLNWTANHDDHSPVAGALTITDNGKAKVYVVAEFPTGLTGRGFTVTCPAGLGYTVILSDRGARWDECECEGFRWKKTCRHCAALRRLADLGKL